MQFTVLVAALAVCTGVFATPVSQHVQAQQTGQAAHTGQAGQFFPFGGLGYGYGGYGYGAYGYPGFYGGASYYGW